LKKYISCGESSLPEIDFNKNSLLLVSGGSERGISAIPKKLQQLSANLYQWDVEILLDEIGELEEWVIAITTSKPIVESAVKLNVSTSIMEHLIDVPFIDYYPKEPDDDIPCWKNIYYDDSVIVINSDEEFEKYAVHSSNYGNVEIDFSKQTLLLASGAITADIIDISKKLRKSLANKYVLDINLRLNTTSVHSKWVVALIINKMSDDSSIELSVTTFENDWKYNCADELFYYSSNPPYGKVDITHNFIDSRLAIWFEYNVQNEEIMFGILSNMIRTMIGGGIGQT
jgi:hypothetical protein